MVGDLNVRCEMFSRIWKGRVQGHSGSDNPEPQPSFDIKRETGNGGVRLLPTLTWLSPLAWYLKTQVDNKSGVFGQSAGFIELKNLKGVLGVFIRRLRLGGRVASTWPGGWGEWPSLITHFPFFLLFDYKKKKIFSDFCQVCSDFQSVTLLDRFFFFSENLHLFWKTECDPPPPHHPIRVSPFLPPENLLPRRCLLTATFGMLTGLKRKFIPHGEQQCRVSAEHLIGQKQNEKLSYLNYKQRFATKRPLARPGVERRPRSCGYCSLTYQNLSLQPRGKEVLRPVWPG